MLDRDSPFLIPVLGAVIFGPMVYRLAMPPPPLDLRAITLFLKNRDETLLTVRKIWFGGPPRYGGRGIYTQTGRPYRVLALGKDGSRWTHELAADERDDLGNSKLQQRLSGVWTPVSQ